MGFQTSRQREEEILKKVNQALAAINTLIKKETEMSQALDNHVAQVTRTLEAEALAILRLQALVQELAAAIANGENSAKLAELTANLDNSAQALAAAVAATTPVVPG